MKASVLGVALVAAVAGVTWGLMASNAEGAAFTAGDIVVARVGDGSAALAGTAAATFLDEYTPAGVFVQTIALPTAASGANDALTNSGTATSEGFLSLSANGQYLTIAGYNAVPGTTITTTTYATINRVVGLIDANGNIDTTTAINSSGSSTGNPRSVAMVGNQLWVTTSAIGVQAITAGTVGAGTQLSSSPTNTRVANIFNGQLYVTSASGAFLGVCTVGSGEPTTSGQTTTLLPGFPSTGTHSNYDYVFADADTLYVADDGALASGGGIQKWVFGGSTWKLVYTLTTGSTSTIGFRGLTDIENGGNITLFATGNDAASGNKLYSVTDTISNTTPYTATFNVLATAGTNMAFRGVELVPVAGVPEPASLGVLGLGISALLLRRRK